MKLLSDPLCDTFSVLIVLGVAQKYLDLPEILLKSHILLIWMPQAL
jgi:hypothetical protein